MQFKQKVVYTALICGTGSFHTAPIADTKQAGKSPVKVFILAGQSNMEGKGAVSNLEYLLENPAVAATYKHLKEKDGSWSVRKDIWIWYLGRKGGLTVGYGGSRDKIGPELQFGHVIGDYLENQVLLIKTAKGGASLAVDFLPPSAGGPGPSYTQTVNYVKDVLKNLKNNFPSYDGKGYQIAGFVWFQGWNDHLNRDWIAKYTDNLAHLIRDFRKEFLAPKMPVVIGELGTGGRDVGGGMSEFRKAQAAVAEIAEFKDTIRFVKTAEYYDMKADEMYRQDIWKGPDKEKFYRIASDRPYHYLGSGKTLFLIGNAFGKAMKELLKNDDE